MTWADIPSPGPRRRRRRRRRRPRPLAVTAVPVQVAALSGVTEAYSAVVTDPPPPLRPRRYSWDVVSEALRTGEVPLRAPSVYHADGATAGHMGEGEGSRGTGCLSDMSSARSSETHQLSDGQAQRSWLPRMRPGPALFNFFSLMLDRPGRWSSTQGAQRSLPGSRLRSRGSATAATETSSSKSIGGAWSQSFHSPAGLCDVRPKEGRCPPWLRTLPAHVMTQPLISVGAKDIHAGSACATPPGGMEGTFRRRSPRFHTTFPPAPPPPPHLPHVPRCACWEPSSSAAPPPPARRAGPGSCGHLGRRRPSGNTHSTRPNWVQPAVYSEGPTHPACRVRVTVEGRESVL